MYMHSSRQSSKSGSAAEAPHLEVGQWLEAVRRASPVLPAWLQLGSDRGPSLTTKLVGTAKLPYNYQERATVASCHCKLPKGDGGWVIEIGTVRREST